MTQRHEPLGLVEHLTPFRVQGWVFDRLDPSLAQDMVLRVDGVPVQWFRPNLRAHSIAQYLGLADALGPTGFNIAAPEILSDGRLHRVEVVHSATGSVLPSAANTVQYTSPHAPLSLLGTSGEKVGTKADTPEVTIVVLNRNGSGVLRALLESWDTHNQRVAVEWIIIDHASTDDSLAMLRPWKKRLNLRIKALQTNDSFSASCNLGARLARSPHLLFLNNDIVWLHDALPHMLQTLRDSPDVGIVGIKLLKTTGPINSANAGNALTDVQHLGVRFKQHDQGYWPYEVSPSLTHLEAEYTPQQVPAVTGAVLICRKTDFDSVGGFDPAYFYGFEDVELCLRLSRRLSKSVVCRNDLVALHHHGHTRLTGREAPIFDRIQHNSAVLNQHIGLWVKVAWWRSLLNADRVVCSETLTIGLQVDQLPRADSKMAPTAKARRQQEAMALLGAQLQQQFPFCRIVLMHPGIDAYDVRGLHAIVVTTPHYDIGSLRHARADLRCIAYVQNQAKAWAAATWYLDFDGYLAASSTMARSMSKETGVAVDACSLQAPLGRWIQGGVRVPTCTALRVAISLPFASSAARTPSVAALLRKAQLLRKSLKQEGAACWIWEADDAARADRRVVDVFIVPLSNSALQSELPVLDPGNFNVVWQQGARGQAPFRWSDEGAQPDLWLSTMPKLAQLQQALETRVGHTFLTP